MCLHLVSDVAPNDAVYGLITTSYLGSLCFEYSVKEQGNVVAVNLVAILFRSNHTPLEGKMSLTTGGTIDQSSSLHLKSFSTWCSQQLNFIISVFFHYALHAVFY